MKLMLSKCGRAAAGYLLAACRPPPCPHMPFMKLGICSTAAAAAPGEVGTSKPRKRTPVAKPPQPPPPVAELKPNAPSATAQLPSNGAASHHHNHHQHKHDFLREDPEEQQEAGRLAPYMEAVVKVYCMHSEPNYSQPWQRKRQYSSTSSGFIARFNGQRCLLTNAHSVDYHTQVRVKRRGDDRKFLARVLSVGVDCDVALLNVEEEEFWSGVTPLEFGNLPRLQDAVAVVGYPVGGDTISVTAGVVSRIEVTEYTHGSSELLAIQIDAAINGGNSGGPVFNAQGQCVGIAFQAMTGSDVEAVGYVIPTPVVHHFLTDYDRTGGFTGFPSLGVQLQRMESEALRKAYGMGRGQKGVMVRNINPTSAVAAALKPNDIILRFDGVEIANDGTVPFRTGERIAFSHLVRSKYVGDACRMDVLRDGQVHELEVRLSLPHSLVPAHLSNRPPSYFIVAGLVFTVCCEPYLQSEYGTDYTTDSPVKLLDRLYHGFPKSPDEEVVVLSQVLACNATLGYEDTLNTQVLRFNGQPINSLRQLAHMVIACREPYMRFDLDYDEVVVLNTQEAIESTSEVMESHSVHHLMSADLRNKLPQWPPSAAAVAGAAEAVVAEAGAPAAAAERPKLAAAPAARAARGAKPPAVERPVAVTKSSSAATARATAAPRHISATSAAAGSRLRARPLQKQSHSQRQPPRQRVV